MVMQSANPYYVDPMQDYSQPLMGLANIAAGIRQRRDASNERARLEGIKKGAIEAFQTGDPDQIASYALQNPEVSDMLSNAFKFKNETTKENMLNSGFEFITNPTMDNAERLTMARQALLKAQGVPEEDQQHTRDFVAQYAQDPEGTKANLEKNLAALAPERYLAYRKAIGTESQTMDEQALAEYMQANPNATMLDAYSALAQAKAGPTITQRDFEMYRSQPGKENATLSDFYRDIAISKQVPLSGLETEQARLRAEQAKAELAKTQLETTAVKQKAEAEKKKEEEAAAEKVASVEKSNAFLDDNLDKVNNALSRLNVIGDYPLLDLGKAKFKPDSPEGQLKNVLDNLLANLSLTSLGDAKEKGLTGQMSNADVQLIRDAVGNLSLPAGRENIRTNLNAIKKILERSYKKSPSTAKSTTGNVNEMSDEEYKIMFGGQ